MKNIAIGAALLWLTACNGTKNEANNAATAPPPSSDTVSLSQDQLKMMQIEVGVAVEKSLQGTIVANGKVTVLANNMADVTALFKGRVERLQVHEGQFVSKGTPILEMIVPDLIDIQAEYLKAKSELLFLNQELERQKILQKESVGAAKNLQEIESKVYFQTAIMESAAAKLRLLGIAPPQYKSDLTTKVVIKAPIAGFIDHFPVSIGTTVTEGMKLAHIQNFDDPHVDIALFEQDLQRVKAGQKVRIVFESSDLPETFGKIEFIGRNIDPVTKTATLHVPFSLPNGKVVATDMRATVYIETQAASSLALPEAAVLQEEDKRFFCYVIDKEIDTKMYFTKMYFNPLGLAQGFIGIGDKAGGKKIVLKGANIILGESKKTAE